MIRCIIFVYVYVIITKRLNWEIIKPISAHSMNYQKIRLAYSLTTSGES